MQNKYESKIINNVSNDKRINLGINILRVILCFWVLSFHCVQKSKTYKLFYALVKKYSYHVPCFSFISFYFSNNIFITRNQNKFKRRIERLLIPYILWPLFSFIIHSHDKGISLRGLILQILLGTFIIIPHWYLFSIIFISIFFFIVSNIFKNYFLFSIKLILIFSYIIQYSYHYSNLNRFKYYIKYPLLHTLGILPIAIVGLMIGHSKIFQSNMNKNLKTEILLFSYILILFLYKFKIFIRIEGYFGIEKIFASIFFFQGFYFLPLEKISSWNYRIIKQITNYTSGIYCLQTIIIPIVKSKLYLFGNLKSVIIIYRSIIIKSS